MYIYIYGYWVQRKIINCRRQNLRRECMWMIFLMATWDVCFRVFFCFHSWFRTCVPCLYLDHLGPPCLKGGVLKAVRPSPSWVSSPRALFLIDFSKRKNSFGLHLDVGGAQGTLSTPCLVTCHFSVGGAQGTLSTPYLVTCHFSVGGAQSALSTPYLVTCHFLWEGLKAP